MGLRVFADHLCRPPFVLDPSRIELETSRFESRTLTHELSNSLSCEILTKCLKGHSSNSSLISVAFQFCRIWYHHNRLWLSVWYSRRRASQPWTALWRHVPPGLSAGYTRRTWSVTAPEKSVRCSLGLYCWHFNHNRVSKSNNVERYSSQD